MKLRVFSLNILALLVLCAGCADSTNSRLDKMNDHMNTLDQQVAGDSQYIKNSSDQLQIVSTNSGRVAQESENYESSVKTLADSLKALAASVDQIEKMGANASQIIKDLMKPTAAGQTSDITDVLKNAGTPAVQAQQQQQAPAPAPQDQPAPQPAEPVAPAIAQIPAVGAPAPQDPPPAPAPQPTGPQNEVNLSQSLCVPQSPQQVLNQILDYNDLYKISGATYQLMGVGPVLTMTKSSSQFNSKTDSASDAFVWLALQPLNLTDSTLYPRFLIRCQSTLTDSGFDHTCTMVQNAEHFGLADFTSHIVGQLNGCNGNQSKITYTLKLVTNENEVKTIKDKALANLGFLASVVSKLFDEDLFFKAYFKNLYESWIQTQSH